ncbi:MAG: hypothetical protein IJ011_04875 [Clostridia bacterium]|nr:hypothetical protein [Clostridia bacterium]
MKIPAFLLTAGADKSLIEELWEYFVDTYIYNETTYENLDFGGMFSAQTLVIGLFLGLAIAGFAAVFNKQIHGAFVSKLISEGCLSPESAKTLPELDAADKLVLRYGVRRGVNLRRVVRCREEEEYNAESEQKAAEYAEMRKENPKLPKNFTPKPFRVDPDSHHFYIPEDMKYMAEVKFNRKGNSWWSAWVFGALILVALVVLIIFLPNILNLIDEFVGSLKG